MKPSLFSLLAVALMAACTKPVDNQTTFTLATGVVMTKSEAFSAPEPTQSLAIEKANDGYRVFAVAALQCGQGQPAPFLTVTIDQKATLVFGRDPGKSTSGCGCECFQRVEVSIQGRLDPGDTLYVLNDYEVIGHVLVP